MARTREERHGPQTCQQMAATVIDRGAGCLSGRHKNLNVYLSSRNRQSSKPRHGGPMRIGCVICAVRAIVLVANGLDSWPIRVKRRYRMSRCRSCGMEFGQAGVRRPGDTERAVYRFEHGRSLAEYCAQCAMWLDSWGEFDGEHATEPNLPSPPSRRLRISSHTPDRDLQVGDTVTEYWFDGRIERSYTARVVGWLQRERYYQVSNRKGLALRWPWNNIYYGDAPRDFRESRLKENARSQLQTAKFTLEKVQRENQRLRARFLNTHGWKCPALQRGRRNVEKAEDAVERAQARLRAEPNEYDLLYRVGERTSPRSGDRALFYIGGEYRPALASEDVRVPIVETLPGKTQVVPVGVGAACPDCETGQLEHAFGKHRVPGSMTCPACHSRFIDTRWRPPPTLPLDPACSPIER